MTTINNLAPTSEFELDLSDNSKRIVSAKDSISLLRDDQVKSLKMKTMIEINENRTYIILVYLQYREFTSRLRSYEEEIKQEKMSSISKQGLEEYEAQFLIDISRPERKNGLILHECLVKFTNVKGSSLVENKDKINMLTLAEEKSWWNFKRTVSQKNDV